MPQMAPIMWLPLFILINLLLLLTKSSIYFISAKGPNKVPSETSHFNADWLW